MNLWNLPKSNRFVKVYLPGVPETIPYPFFGVHTLAVTIIKHTARIGRARTRRGSNRRPPTHSERTCVRKPVGATVHGRPWSVNLSGVNRTRLTGVLKWAGIVPEIKIERWQRSKTQGNRQILKRWSNEKTNLYADTNEYPILIYMYISFFFHIFSDVKNVNRCKSIVRFE